MVKEYRLVEESELRKLIEGNMIYEELRGIGIDNWIGCDFIHYPDIDEIEAELNKFDNYVKPVEEDD